jgi:hypothetical protein
MTANITIPDSICYQNTLAKYQSRKIIGQIEINYFTQSQILEINSEISVGRNL